jgi:30S ribosomal protein S31
VGKGDQRTKRGKIWRGTFGKRRLRKKKKGLLARPAEKSPSTPTR